MSKTVIIGDTHGRKKVIDIINKELDSSDKIILMGDYWDSFDVPFIVQKGIFNTIIELKKENPDKIVLLIGNHDGLLGHYSDYHLSSGIVYSGFQAIYAREINYLFEQNKKLFQAAYQEGEILCTHAGVSERFLRDNGYYIDEIVEEEFPISEFINDLAHYKPQLFCFKNSSPQERWVDIYGNNDFQSPIWIRPKSLMKCNYKNLRTELIQIVGHTGQNGIDIKGKATGGRYYFIDTIGVGEYLIIENGEFKLGKINGNGK